MAAGKQDEIRYPMDIKWGRELGWLAIRDPFDGGWHEVRAKEAPPAWRTAANRAKMNRSTQPATGRSTRSRRS